MRKTDRKLLKVFPFKMMIKLYCLVLRGGKYEDMEMTLDFQRALDWLYNGKKSRQILEYTVSDHSIADCWERIWYYGPDGNLKHD